MKIQLRSYPRKKPVPHEHLEQCQVIQWAKAQLSTYPELGLLYAIPNASKSHVNHRMKLKAEGLKPGVPDLCLPVARQGYHGLYIEMKAKGGTTSLEQRAWIEALKEQGYLAGVCRSWQQAVQKIENYLGMNRQ